MTTFADRVYQLGGVPVGGPVTQGHVFFVKPYSGRDAASGKSPAEAVKTLGRALALATEDQNDIVYLMSEGNASASCTDYQSTTLDWNKDEDREEDPRCDGDQTRRIGSRVRSGSVHVDMLAGCT